MMQYSSVGRRRWLLLLAVGIWLQAPHRAAAQESLPAGAKVVRLQAHPSAITLKSPLEYRQLLITAFLWRYRQ